MVAERQVVIGRDEAINLLRCYKHEIEQRYGVTAMGLFGSLARDQATAASDVDVVVRLRDPDLFTLVHIKEGLEAAFHRHVDIIHYREKMNPYLKHKIDKEAVYV